MSDVAVNPFAEIGEQLGLGSRWQPAVLAWGFAPASMREFARQSTEQVTGLVLPTTPGPTS